MTRLSSSVPIAVCNRSGFCPCTSKGGIKRAGRTYRWNSWCSYLKQSALVDNDPIKQITPPGGVIKNKGCSGLLPTTLSTQFLTRWTQPGGNNVKKKKKTIKRNISTEEKIPNTAPVLDVWECVQECFFFPLRERDDSLATTQRCSRFHLHIFAPDWFQLSHALPRGVLLLLLLSPRATHTFSIMSQSTCSGIEFQNKKAKKNIIEWQVFVWNILIIFKG